MSVLTVGPSGAFARIGTAIDASQDGDVVAVQAGSYVNDFANIFHRITLQAVGGPVRMLATIEIGNGRGILVTWADATIDGFEFAGARVADQNGAGIRYQSGHLIVRNSYFHNNENGLLGAADPTGSILIQDSEFAFNGTGDGFSHGIYIGAVAEATVERSYLHDTHVGHELKSRALKTTVRDNHIQDNASDTSYEVDLPQGGIGLIERNVIQQGVNGQNTYIFAFGEENNVYASSSLLIQDNIIVNDAPNPFGVLNGAPVTVLFRNNAVFGFGGIPIDTGFVEQVGTTVLDVRPPLYPVPEPASILLLAVAAILLAYRRYSGRSALASSAACRI